jgi:uncharacterized membrane protein
MKQSEEIVENAINRCKGEIFEARCIIFFALVSLVISVLLYKKGTMPGAKALTVPLVVIGLLARGLGGSMLVSNLKRIVSFQQAFEAHFPMQPALQPEVVILTKA